MRTFLFTLAALAIAGTAATVAVAPAAADHWHYRSHYSHYRYHYWRPSVRYYAPRAYSCYVRRVVPTIFGPRVEWINRCS